MFRKIADISGDDVLRLRFYRAFQNFVVIRVACRNHLISRSYQARSRAKSAERLTDFGCVEPEFLPPPYLGDCLKHSLGGVPYDNA